MISAKKELRHEMYSAKENEDDDDEDDEDDDDEDEKKTHTHTYFVCTDLFKNLFKAFIVRFRNVVHAKDHGAI